MNTARWQCFYCGHVYDEAEGQPDAGVAPGTAFADLPDDWVCPGCAADKGDFQKLDA